MNGTVADAGYVVVAVFMAGCCCLYLLNRLLVLFGEGLLKNTLIVLAFLVPTGLFIAAARLLPDPLRGGLAASGVTAVLALEARRLRLRRRWAGSPPVDTIPHRVDLSRPLTTTDIVTHRYTVRIAGWNGPSVRVAHVSDLHVNAFLPEQYFRDVLDLAEAAEPDYVFLTGDFVTKASAIPLLRSVLRPVGERGAFAVLGNHDYWADEAAVRDTVRAAGITLLKNESREAAFGDGRILLTGTDHPWDAGIGAIPRAGPGVLHLVLSHTPDNIHRISRSGAHCVFSGHIHAGQFRIPWLGPLFAPSLHGRLFDHGHFVVEGTHLFVVSGVGAGMPPFRLYCQPDIFVVDISGDGPAAAT